MQSSMPVILFVFLFSIRLALCKRLPEDYAGTVFAQYYCGNLIGTSLLLNPTYTTSNGSGSSPAEYTSPTSPAATSLCTAIAPVPSAVACPASNSTLFTPQGDCIGGDTSYGISCGISYNDANLMTIPDLASFEDCAAFCSLDTSCIAVSFNTGTGACQIKGTFGWHGLVHDPDLIFGFNVRYVALAEVAIAGHAGEMPPNATLPLPVVPLSEACPEYRNSEVEAEDGSQWVVNCNASYEGTIIPGPKLGLNEATDACANSDVCIGITGTDQTGYNLVSHVSRVLKQSMRSIKHDSSPQRFDVGGSGFIALGGMVALESNCLSICRSQGSYGLPQYPPPPFMASAMYSFALSIALQTGFYFPEPTPFPFPAPMPFPMPPPPPPPLPTPSPSTSSKDVVISAKTSIVAPPTLQPSSTASIKATSMQVSNLPIPLTCSATPTCAPATSTVTNYTGFDGSLFQLRCGHDYGGNDYPDVNTVDTIAVASLNECIGICVLRGPRCAGAAWIPSFPNTCWLKSFIPAAVLPRPLPRQIDTFVRLSRVSDQAATFPRGCDGIRSLTPGSLRTTDGSNWSIACNVVLAGTQIAQMTASSLEICLDRCALWGPSCLAATFGLDNGPIAGSHQNYCTLFSRINANQGVAAGIGFQNTGIFRQAPLMPPNIGSCYVSPMLSTLGSSGTALVNPIVEPLASSTQPSILQGASSSIILLPAVSSSLQSTNRATSLVKSEVSSGFALLSGASSGTVTVRSTGASNLDISHTSSASVAILTSPSVLATSGVSGSSEVPASGYPSSVPSPITSSGIQSSLSLLAIPAQSASSTIGDITVVLAGVSQSSSPLANTLTVSSSIQLPVEATPSSSVVPESIPDSATTSEASSTGSTVAESPLDDSTTSESAPESSVLSETPATSDAASLESTLGYLSSQTATLEASTTSSLLPTPSCIDGDQTIYTGAGGSQFRLDCGLDSQSPRTELDQFAGLDINQCFEMCAQRGPACAGVVWVPSYVGNLNNPWSCWFKTAIPAGSEHPQAYECDTLARIDSGTNLASAVAPMCDNTVYIANEDQYTTADNSTFQIDCGHAFLGSSIVSRQATSLALCISACAAWGEDCWAANFYVSPDGNPIHGSCALVSGSSDSVVGTDAYNLVVHGAIRSEHYVASVTATSSTAATEMATTSYAITYTTSTQTSCTTRPTPSCPGADQSVFTGYDGSTFRLDCNLDSQAVGVDSDQYAGSSITECMEMCDMRGPSCQGVTFVPSFVGSNLWSCWFKTNIAPGSEHTQSYECDTVVRLTSNSTLATGVAPACNDILYTSNEANYQTSDGTAYDIMCGQSFQGTSLLTSPGSSLQGCLDRCSSWGQECEAVNFAPNGSPSISRPFCQLIGSSSPPQNGISSVGYIVHGGVKAIGPAIPDQNNVCATSLYVVNGP